MRKTREKQPIDLLSLSKKDRIRLCKEIHKMLRQRVQEERHLEKGNVPKVSQLRNNINAETYESYFLKSSLVRPGII